MTIRDLLQETSTGLLSNKVRTGLTMLGIVIGIASVIAMLGIGNGATNSIQARIESIGANLVVISPGAPRTPGSQVRESRGSANTLTMDDVSALASQVTSAKEVAPSVSVREQVVAAGTNTNTSIIGTTPSYADIRDVAIDTGTFFTDDQVTNLARVAVLGPTTRDDLFGVGADVVGQSIRINGNIFTVIGVTVAKGGSGPNSTDDIVYIPITVAQQFFMGNLYVSAINISAQTAALVTDVQNQATDILLQRHNITDPTKADFSTLNQSDILATASSITGTMTALLAAIAGISLLVGGIGIMNMMLTTVTERTREIGLRKAVGAKKSDIRLQFLVESVMLTAIGGIIGIILGIAIAWILTLTGLLTAQVSLTSVILSFGVSAIIGIVFGYYPAARASDLNPIDALRYE
ncbi:ABC transporter permease [Candidatus Magnetominusculus dajiuhuensis]|uniref:ABC transporter permease n=1 Tax=Candidatus Magnetominusculus dajiuhuensis TaxID=3137712 RepID=UPI003B435B06